MCIRDRPYTQKCRRKSYERTDRQAAPYTGTDQGRIFDTAIPVSYTHLLAAVLAFPANVWAAGSGEAAAQVPVWLCIPFAGLLLCIAVMPLVKGEWWEAHQPLVVGFWIAAMVIPFIVVYGAGKTVETVLECTVNDYLTFIILLFGLFCVSGKDVYKRQI